MVKFRNDLYADVRIEDRFTTEIIYRNGNLEESGETSVKKAFLRVYDGKMWYYASTSDTSNIQAQLDVLYCYAKSNPDIYSDPAVTRYETNTDTVMKYANASVKNVPIEKKHALLLNVLCKLNSDYLKIKTGAYIDRYSVYKFYSSKGAKIQYDFQTAGAAFDIGLAKANGENFQNRLDDCRPRFEELAFSDEDIAAFLAESDNFIKNAKTLDKAGSYPVVLAPQVTGVFAHESFGHNSEADFMLGDETLAKEWELGKKVGSDKLTIVDTGTIEGSGYVPYDDEGTKAGVTYLVKDGILSGRLHSTATAASLGEDVTGNARAINCDYEPIVRMTTTYIAAGNDTLEELIAGIEDGFYIKTCTQGSGMSTFTIAPNLAYEIKHGKIASPVKIAVISGNVFKTLNLIDGVGNDEKFLSFVTGGCGKMEQFPLNVGLGGPSVRVSEMNVQ